MRTLLVGIEHNISIIKNYANYIETAAQIDNDKEVSYCWSEKNGKKKQEEISK